MENRIDLKNFSVASSSAYPQACCFADQRELANTAKALVNIVLSRSASHSSPTTALTHLETLCSWMRRNDIYHLQDLTRDQLNQFIGEAAKGRGLASGMNDRLMGFLKNFENEKDEQVARSLLKSYLLPRKKPGEVGSRFVFDQKKLSDAIGMKVTIRLPRDFIEKVASLTGVPLDAFILDGYGTKPISVTTLERIANTVNLLSLIPIGFDSVRFYAFPDTSDECLLKLGAFPRGRTANLPLENAVDLMATGARWIIDYADAFLSLGNAARNLLTTYPNTLWYHVPLKLALEVNRIKITDGVDLNSLIEKKIENLEDVVYALHLLTAAAVSVLFSNTARRRNEIVSDKYGLTFGCLEKSDLGVYSMRVYIEKTLKQYVVTKVNYLAGMSIEVLKKIQRIYSDLGENQKVAENDSLFTARVSFTTDAFSHDKYTKPDFAGKYLPAWTQLVLGKHSMQVLPHMWRRFYAVLYFYRYDFPQLSALSKHFFHFNENHTFIYITDKSMVEYVDSIPTNMRLHEVRFQGKVVAAIEEFDIKYIKLFDGVAEEYMLSTIMKASEGETSGGFVRSLLKRVADYVKLFNTESTLSDPERFIPLAKKLIKEGHIPMPFSHGVCFANRKALYEAHEANCAKDGKLDRSKASCTVCSSCSNHGTHNGTMNFLTKEIAFYENVLNDFSLTAFEHAHARQELDGLQETMQYHLSELEKNKKRTNQLFGSGT